MINGRSDLSTWFLPRPGQSGSRRPTMTHNCVSSDRSIAGEKPTDRGLTGHEHRTLEFENRSLDNYCPDRDDLFIASNAASASSGRARTTKSSVRFTQRTFPDGSIRNSAGREMSAPSRRPCTCTRSHLRITSSCASERIGNV